MKRVAVVTFIICLLGMPIQTQAQFVPRASEPPVLTQDAANCALYMIQFMAAEARGVNVFEITEETSQIWLKYLAYYYPMLDLQDQTWFAGACETLDANVKGVPQMDPTMRDRLREVWSSSVQPFFAFIQPVLIAAERLRADKLRAAANGIQNRDPGAELRRQREMADSLMDHNRKMNSLTNGLIDAMRGRR